MNTFEKTPLQISLCLIIIQQQTYLLITSLHNFNLLFEFRTTSTIISTKATLQLRIAIPNGVSSGVDINFL
jgi:hypothetical protein